jgi:hypothetical protein
MLAGALVWNWKNNAPAGSSGRGFLATPDATIWLVDIGWQLAVGMEWSLLPLGQRKARRKRADLSGGWLVQLIDYDKFV